MSKELTKEEIMRARVSSLREVLTIQTDMTPYGVKIYDIINATLPNHTVEPVIVLGYLYKNQAITADNIKSIDSGIWDEMAKDDYLSSNIKYIGRIIHVNKGSFGKAITIGSGDIVRIAKDNAYSSVLQKCIGIKIKSYELSGNVFGLKTIKQKLVGSEPESYVVEKDNVTKIGESSYYIKVPYKDKNIKFCLEDVEFKFPNIKGYNPPKDKTIYEGSIVKIVKNHNNRNIPLNTELRVFSIRRAPNSSRISNKTTNRKLDVIFGGDSVGKTYKVYAKNLKLISNESRY